MKIFLVVLVAAVASARRPPRGFDIDYSDSPPFFDSPPPPLASSRPSFSFSRHQPYPRVLKSFSDDTSIISDGPPPRSFRGEKIIYGSLPPTSYYPRRPHSFYKSGASSFAQELSILDEYRGPPPPAPNVETSVTRDERPSAALLQFPTTMADEQESYKSTKQPISPEIPTRQPLSFGGHSNHLSYGNHALGFASVAGASSAHLDPLAIAETTRESTSTTTPMPTTPSTVSPSEVQVSQQQPVTYTPNPTDMPTSAAPKAISTATQPSTTKTASSPSDSEPTASSTSPTTAAAMTSVTPKTHLDLARNSPSQTTKAVPMMLQEPLRTSHEFRTVTQELPAAAHGQLPLKSPRPEPSHVLDIKQNLLQEENKANFPYQQFDYQFHQQNSNNAAPLRFTIPTATISSAPPSAASATAADAAAVLPANPATQGLSFPQMPLALAAVPNSNTYSIRPNQIDVSQFGQLGQINTGKLGANQIDISQLGQLGPINTGRLGPNQIDLSQLGQFGSINTAPQLPSYYYSQSNEQLKPAPQISSNIPLASFYMLPNNNAQPVQPTQINTGASPGIPLHFNGFGGIELLSSSSNSIPVRSDILGLERSGLNIQGHLQSQGHPLARMIFGQNIW